MTNETFEEDVDPLVYDLIDEPEETPEPPVSKPSNYRVVFVRGENGALKRTVEEID